jgi:hypothetical protein
MKRHHLATGIGLALACIVNGSALAQQPASVEQPVIQLGNQEFATWQEYLSSNAFQALGLRCGLPTLDPGAFADAPGDCTLGSTTIKSQFNPTGVTYQIPCVVHIIMNTSGQGAISDALVQSQIDILNEDFNAIAGTNGGNGNFANFQFYLADRDPAGNPTTGITRSTNNTWFQDSGAYYNTLAWDTNRYLNFYTNQAGGALGYVPNLPNGGNLAGSLADRVVILWSAFGRNAPIGPPYNQGRTATHEVGHYFGLYHTFQGACAPASSCYTNGDLICDTLPDQTSHFGCPLNANTCSNPDPITNYMEYTDDLCMEEFTPEQVNRMRCTIDAYRPNLSRPPAGCTAALTSTRNQSPNPNVYTATNPVLGQPVTFSVNTSGFQFATIVGVSSPATKRLDNGYFALINVDSQILLNIGPLAGPNATTQQIVSNDPAMCGITIYTQAKLTNTSGPFALTNAQDLRIGN